MSPTRRSLADDESPRVDRVQAAYDRWVRFAFGALLGATLGFTIAASDHYTEWWQFWGLVTLLSLSFGACSARFGDSFWEFVADHWYWPWRRL